mmetsp:Transcript_105880/g.146439  ORF Transcript_105880/g.146439 Transcript_105880/m.146439 type:complete len:142 (+) Transcript_105880:390-815(+)
MWRGNMPSIYKSFMQMTTKISMYDSIKNYWMPFDHHKYSGMDYYWRSAASASMCMALSTFFVYPLDFIHTRITADMTSKGKTRLHNTTFDCFNKANLDEGRWALYKGAEVMVVSSLIRAALTLPVYDMVRRYSQNNGRDGR